MDDEYEEYDSICDMCGLECNSTEKNKCADETEVCNECFAQLVSEGKETL